MPPHCDSLDGPVVNAAREALASNNVDRVLPFAPASAEAEIRGAFDLVVKARRRAPESAEVADRWFFETVVRLHRAGEGESFEGLKPAGLDTGPVVPLADKAILSGDLKPLYGFLTRSLHEALHERFDAAMSQKTHDPRDVAAARAYTSAMLGFIVWSHQVYAAFSKDVHGEGRQVVAAAQGHAH